MSAEFVIPDWMRRAEPPQPLDLGAVDPHRIESMVNDFIAAKQDALFTAPDAFYRQTGADAVDGAPSVLDRLARLRQSTLDQAQDDGERALLGPRLDLHLDDARDGIDRHVGRHRDTLARQTIAERRRLIQRAAELDHNNDDKLGGLAEAHASAAQELARLNGEPEEPAAESARSAIWRSALGQRLANGDGAQAIALFDRIKDRLAPADRRALDGPMANAATNLATDAWIAREDARPGAPLDARASADPALSPLERATVMAKGAVRDSAREARRVATLMGTDDKLAAATRAIATAPAIYRRGTVAALANAYEEAGEPTKAASTRHIALLEGALLPFARSSAERQQRFIDSLSEDDPIRAIAEAIQHQQNEAFARDPYAAGIALYPEIGPPLPAEDEGGRLRQARMIEAMRGTSASPDTTAETTNAPPAASPTTSLGLSGHDRVWTDGQSPQGADPNLIPAADETGEPPLAPIEAEEGVEVAQAPSKTNPQGKPRTPSTNAPKPAAVPTKPAANPPANPAQTRRTEQAATNRKEIDRLAGKPASDYPSEESFPADWEKRLPQATLDAVNREAKAFKVPPELLARIMWKESKFEERAGEKDKLPGQGIAGMTDIAMRQLIQNRLEAA